MNAPIPNVLTEDQRSAYLELLHQKVLVLLNKAIRAFEISILISEKTGYRGEWIDEIKESINRVQKLYLERFEPTA
jgi:hypothetical protein